MGRQSYIEGEHKVCTLEEYFLFEDSSLEKHEWRNGEVFAMAGSTPPQYDSNERTWCTKIQTQRKKLQAFCDGH